MNLNVILINTFLPSINKGLINPYVTMSFIYLYNKTP